MNRFFKSHLFIYLVVSLVYIGINSKFLLVDPKPWPDEAVYADVAVTFLKTGKIATELWQGLIHDVENAAVWNPPGLFLLTAAMFKIFSAGLMAQRLISATAGLGVILLILDIARTLTSSKKAYWLWLLGLAILADYQFMVATRISRPEIMVLLLGLLGWRLLLKPKLTSNSSFLSGLIIGLAFLFHPLGLSMASIGLIEWLVKWKYKDHNRLALLPYLVGVGLPLIAWTIWMYPYWPTIYTQFQLAAVRKYMEDPWIIISFKNHILLVQVIFILIGILLSLHVLNLRKANANLLTLVRLTLIFTLISIWARMAWYTVYLLPFLYLSLIYQITLKQRASVIFLCFFTALILTNSRYSWKNLLKKPIPINALNEYCQNILQSIPENKIVFLSAVPDPYYCFLEGKRNNVLREFPVLPISLNQYKTILDQSDYVIYQGSYETVLFGNFLIDYLKNNSADTLIIQDSSKHFKAWIYNLKK